MSNITPYIWALIIWVMAFILIAFIVFMLWPHIPNLFFNGNFNQLRFESVPLGETLSGVCGIMQTEEMRMESQDKVFTVYKYGGYYLFSFNNEGKLISKRRAK